MIMLSHHFHVIGFRITNGAKGQGEAMKGVSSQKRKTQRRATRSEDLFVVQSAAIIFLKDKGADRVDAFFERKCRIGNDCIPHECVSRRQRLLK